MKNPAGARAAPTALLSALLEEQQGLIERLEHPQKIQHASRDFWCGDLFGHPVVLALSKIGKVAAATTATTLIERFGVARMVFTGVAGGLAPGIQVGDVVVGKSFMQHDMDASPLFARYEVPLHAKTLFDGDAALTDALFKASGRALADPHVRQAYPAACAHLGLIASGDRFVSGAAESAALRRALLSAGHDALAVEMEGAAVAQVCHDHGVPFAAVRTVSDRADGSAHVDFPRFIEQVASRYAVAVVRQLFKALLK